MDKQLTQPAATIDNGIHKDCYLVVHPLDDYREQKLKTDHLLPLEMAPTLWWSLVPLRAYLILMIVLCFYHVIDLAAHVLNK